MKTNKPRYEARGCYVVETASTDPDDKIICLTPEAAQRLAARLNAADEMQALLQRMAGDGTCDSEICDNDGQGCPACEVARNILNPSEQICPSCYRRMDLVCDPTGEKDHYHCFACATINGEKE